jgi:hypothetical protein
MNRITVALLAALEAVIIAAIGIGIALVPLTILWATQFHLSVDFGAFWRAASDIWLIGHGVDVTFALDKVTASTLGLQGASAPFAITIDALGFSALVAIAAFRTGTRAAATNFRLTGAVVSILVYAAIAAGVTLTAGSALARPVLWQGIVLPTFVFALGVIIGVAVADPRLRDLAPGTTATVVAVLRGGTAAAALILGAAGVLVAVLVVGNYATLVGLYESLQSGTLGGSVITVGQLAFLPNAVIWAASWLAGPGFALGTGSSVSPLGTELGPVPSIPLLGIVPSGDLAFGFVGLLVPVIAGFVAAKLLRARLHDSTAGLPATGRLALIAVLIGAVAGLQIGLLAWWSSGAIGPGRLQDAGPNPWLTGGAIAVEVAIAALAGLLTGERRTSGLGR